MKNIAINTAIVLVVAASVGGCASRRSEPIKGKPFVAQDMSVQHGQEVYMKNCQKCHPSGEGGLGPSINANPAPGFIKKFQVRHGLGVMPSFKKNEISKQDLKDVAKFMKAWKHY